MDMPALERREGDPQKHLFTFQLKAKGDGGERAGRGLVWLVRAGAGGASKHEGVELERGMQMRCEMTHASDHDG